MTLHYAFPNANLTLTTTRTPLPGCEVLLTDLPAAQRVVVVGVFDFAVTSLGANTCVGELEVDGALLASPVGDRQAYMHQNGTRATVTQAWNIEGFDAGSDHTLRITARKSGASGTATCSYIHSCMYVFVEPLV